MNERPDYHYAHEDSVRSGPTETEHSQPRDREPIYAVTGWPNVVFLDTMRDYLIGRGRALNTPDL